MHRPTRLLCSPFTGPSVCIVQPSTSPSTSIARHPLAHLSSIYTIHWLIRLHGTSNHRPTRLHGPTLRRPIRLLCSPHTSPLVSTALCSPAQIPRPIRLHHILHSIPIPNTFLCYPILYTTGPSLSIGYTLYSGPLVYIATLFVMGQHGMARPPWYIVTVRCPV